MRDVILTDRGPKPIGPYSQAIRANGFLYVSGQVALDPKTGEMPGADIKLQTERTLENLKGILEAAGSNLHHVVKTTVFLKDINDFAAMNEVYAKYFTAAPPTRSSRSKSSPGCSEDRLGCPRKRPFRLPRPRNRMADAGYGGQNCRGLSGRSSVNLSQNRESNGSSACDSRKTYGRAALSKTSVKPNTVTTPVAATANQTNRLLAAFI